MAKKTEALTPREALRKGWLAYLGVYGAAFERVQPLREKARDTFETLVTKGEGVEGQAQEVVETVRERTNDFYGVNFDRVRKFMPAMPVARKGRVEELEAEIEALNKRVAALSKKPAAKRTTKKAA